MLLVGRSLTSLQHTTNGVFLTAPIRKLFRNTARLDYLFEHGIPSVGIGDGGNEIGMGNLAEVIPGVDRLVLASVSNWGVLCSMSIPRGGERGGEVDTRRAG